MTRSRFVSLTAVVMLLVAFFVGAPAQDQSGAVDTGDDDETEVEVDAITPDEAFVLAAYEDFLGRTPTDEELADVTADPLDTEAARFALVDELSLSAEWIAHTVERLYLDTLGRPGEEGGTEFWIEKLAAEEVTVAQAAASFYSSDEYFEGFGENDVTIWVTDLYTKILLRTPEQEGIDYWVEATELRGRWWVASAFYQSDESCHTRVKNLYEIFLGRAPETGGWNYWSARVNADGDLALAAFLASSNEYYDRAWDRFGPEPEPTTTTVEDTTTTQSTLETEPDDSVPDET